jgi:hypothetical protein
VTYVGDSADSNVYLGWGQSIAARSSDGSIIVLNDGSIWIVAGYDRPTSALWLDGTSIIVSNSGDQLIDADDHEVIDAHYIGQE